ncbi:methylated-DNA--[protein]-cysteine S-methyltransferase [Teredinibacter purpureus]|uniref:methylated-DNA--[protein]-cysteine S-methyltransferase n=1 Tax=Teredinibacter purpureus TaxID=2731756 RepID=UPI0005F77475|nr:methylated-DNA--[protein]-cysteine S-methyltransferase [Teredinibacter purpureus]
MNNSASTPTHKRFQRMCAAIEYLRLHFRSQPSVANIAQQLNMSSDHLHHLFKQWVGISPKQFLQCVTVENAKPILAEQHSCIETSNALGLSSSSRLHDHLVSLEAVTPGDIKARGEGLTFYFGEGNTPLGIARLCWTKRGIHSLKFTRYDGAERDNKHLRQQWSAARWEEQPTEAQQWLNRIFSKPSVKNGTLKLYVQGTNFQIAVWRALLNIPQGTTLCYGEVAVKVGNPNASRAAGTAIGKNPVAVLIPCHRVIRESGLLGGYRWGLDKKTLLLAKELLIP